MFPAIVTSFSNCELLVCIEMQLIFFMLSFYFAVLQKWCISSNSYFMDSLGSLGSIILLLCLQSVCLLFLCVWGA